ncbi:MAG TPA: tetratricopeptide repeat protein [Nannocystaceae bacterium]|nr:tetratricopeptide repeat protein [Nannocystaceae bacterium]
MDRHVGSTRLHAAAALLAAILVGCQDSPSSTASATGAAVEPTATVVAPANAELALAYVPGEGATELAIAAAQQAVRSNPELVAAYTELARQLMRRARETSDASYRLYADDALRAARARDPRDPQAMVLSAMILQDGHRFRGAASLAREFIALAPDDSTGHLVLGDALLELGDYDAAIDAYQQAMNLRPDLRSYNRAAHMKWMLGDVNGAREVMALALDAGSVRDPESRAWCYVDLAEIDLHRGEPEAAMMAADAALVLVPDYVPARSVKARVLQRQGKVAEAVELLAGVVEQRASSDDLLRLAEWSTALGDEEGARARLAQARALADAEPRPLAHWLARHTQEPERALALAKAELDARANLAAQDTMALALLRAGQVVAARASIEAALRLGTPDAELHLHAGLIAVAEGKLDVAKQELAKANRLDRGADPLLADELRRAVGES